MTKLAHLLFCCCCFLCAAPLVAQEISILNPDTITICRGDVVQLRQTNTVGDAGLTWRPEAGFVDPVTSPNPRVAPQVSRYYVVSVSTTTGVAADSVWIDVANFVAPALIDDTLHCGSTPLQLVAARVEDAGDTRYDWSPGSLLEDSTDVNATFQSPTFVDTVFTLIATAENGACADTQSVRVEIIPSQLVVEGGTDTIFRCDANGPIVLSATATPPEAAISWRPSTAVQSDLTGTSIQVEPIDPIVYYAEAVVNGCPQIDSVAVRTDSLPQDLGFTVDPVKDPYCQGDTFTIKSPIYDVGDFPLIAHDWLVAPGLASPDDLYNAVVFASDSALFTRVTTNGSCRDTVRQQINVIQPPILIFDPADPVVCPGEPLEITVSFSPEGPEGTLEWMDPLSTLSCTDCLDPVATVQMATTYMIEVTSEGSECTSPVEYTVRVADDGQPILTDSTLVCAGDSRQLIVGGVVDDYTYRITGGGVDSTDPTTRVTPTGPATTYTIETTGDCGTSAQSITLNVAADYTLDIDAPAAVCSGDEVSLSASTSNGIAGTYTWTINNSRTERGQQITDAPQGTSTYEVTFEDALGCGTMTAEVTVSVIGDNLNPDAVAINTDGEIVTSVAAGGQVALTVINFPDEPGTTYAWTGNPGLEPATGSGRTLTVTAPPPGQSTQSSATYSVAITTAEGCTFTRVVSVTIVTANFEFPELITPNGDNRNDVFRIFATTGAEITDYSLVVFNRWGQKVFTSASATEGWDGTKNGTPQNQDTYLYLASFRLNGTEVSRDGQFSLVR